MQDPYLTVEHPLVIGSEVIKHVEIAIRGRRELYDAVAVIGGSVPRAVAGGEVDVAVRVACGPAAAHPDTTSAIVRRGVERGLLGQRARVVGDDPTVPGVNVAM